MILPISGEVFELSLEHQRQHDLDPADALILASVITDATRGSDRRNVFVTRNKKDFDRPLIRSQLAEVGCDLALSFPEACEAADI